MRKALMGLAGLAMAAATLAACDQPFYPVSLDSRFVTYGHAQVDIPIGWKVDSLHMCEPQPDTVVVVDPATVSNSCGLKAKPKPKAVRTIYVTRVYATKDAPGWVGTPVNWEGQQAWLQVSPPQPGTSALARLTLPWLNVRIFADAPDATTARALLNNVHVRPGTTLEVPASADSVTVQQGKSAPLTTSRQADINTLLSNLRQLEIVSPSAVCAKVMKSGPKQFWTITFTKAGKSTLFMLPMNGCKQVTSGTGVVALTNYKFWLDFNRQFATRPFASPLCCAPAPTVAPKNSFYFDGDSYIYPASAGATPRFTREQFLKALPAQVGSNAGTPQVYLVMSKGPYRGATAPTLLMWVARYNKPLTAWHSCPAIRTKADAARCAAQDQGQHRESFVFYDANNGLFDMTIQLDGSKVAPGHLTINQWDASYTAARR